MFYIIVTLYFLGVCVLGEGGGGGASSIFRRLSSSVWLKRLDFIHIKTSGVIMAV